jgi:hypothetical protein
MRAGEGIRSQGGRWEYRWTFSACCLLPCGSRIPGLETQDSNVPVLDAEKVGTAATPYYARKMGRMKRQIETNEEKRKIRFASNETLAASMEPYPMLMSGVKMMAAQFANRLLPPGKVITLPL